jgi:uncharacterized protein
VQPLRPTPAGERLVLPDALRGLALLIIAAVNALLIFQPESVAPWEARVWTGIDGAARTLLRVLFEGKGYALFSFLFGLGFALQIARSGDTPAGRRIYRRRMFVLAAIGVAHGLLLFHGDILLPYALLGLALPLVAQLSNRALLGTAAALLAVPVVLYGALAMALAVGGGAAEAARLALGPVAPSPVVATIYAEGGWAAVTAQRAADLVRQYAGTVSYGFVVGPLFLLGLAAGRSGLLAAGPAQVSAYRRLAATGLTVGLALSAAVAALGSSTLTAGSMVATMVQPVAGVVLAAGYVGALGLAVTGRGGHQQGWVGVLAAAGRMPLTHYLVQSAVFTTLAYGYGLGLYGRVGPAGVLAIAAGVFALQAAASGWWLRRYRFGPAEWAWRRAAYRAAMRSEP